ncbi:GMC family oxidoreductase [bacterium]|nr:GMC family oxidoreductase [bacterium]MCI0604245.1 GMC family oxidoreductase [bacterium]
MKMLNQDSYDAIIIGAGPNGEWMAKGLSEGGLRVLVLDAGPLMKERDFARTPKDGILQRAGFFLGKHRRIAAAAVLNTATSRFYVDERQNPYTHPGDKPFRWFRGRQVGGRGHTWGRLALRYAPVDFRTTAEDGATWPICYEDLEPYYGQVEEFLLLEGRKDSIESLPDGKYVREHELTPTEQRFKEAVQKKWPHRPVIPVRVLGYPHGPVSPMLQSALNTGRAVLRPSMVVDRILTESKAGRATGVSCIEISTDKRMHFYSEIVVCCASTIETIRLLLNSNGLGNSSGLLGCYLMDHINVWLSGSTSESSHIKPNWFNLSSDMGIYLPRIRRREFSDGGFIGTYGVQGSLGRAGKFWSMGANCEMLPRRENRVTLDPNVKDKWGVPAAHIQCKFSENEFALREDAVQAMREMAQEAGFSTSRDFVPLPLRMLSAFVHATGLINDGPVPGAAIHESGGVRMGQTPKDSILNKHNQMWEIPNLFVVDSSCFPAISFQHPTLTTMALALRACNYILSSKFKTK